MSDWIATYSGALDLQAHALASDGFDLVVTPGTPGVPRILFGPGAQLWRRLFFGGLSEDDLSMAERTIVREFEEFGIAAVGDPRGVVRLDRPWLSSVVHELVYALLAHVASENQIDIMFIKGPTLHAQGLRTREHSGDVDCLVLPGEDLRLARGMEMWGWNPVITPLTGTGVSHSLTLSAPSWACAVDVHTRFPGISLEPAAAFEMLYQTGEDRRFASTSVRTPSRSAHAVIAALHAMRPYQGRPPTDNSITAATEYLVAAGREVIDQIVDLRAGYVLQEPFSSAFPSDVLHDEALVVPFDWGWRSSPQGAHRHLQALTLVPRRLRLRTLIRLVWPRRQQEPTNEVAGRAPLVVPRSRVRRFFRALVDLLGLQRSR